MENREIPTAEEIYYHFIDKDYLGVRVTHQDKCLHAMIEFARLHVQRALESAAENAQVTNEIYKSEVNKGSWYQEHNVDKQSILNAYPLDQIK